MMPFIRVQTGCKLPDLCSFFVSVQAKPNLSVCSHPYQCSHDQTRAALSQEAPLAALGVAATYAKANQISSEECINMRYCHGTLLPLVTSMAHPQNITPVLTTPLYMLLPGV